MSAARPPGSRAALAALVQLDGVGPARLRELLEGRTPLEAYEAVVSGQRLGGVRAGPERRRGWRQQLARADRPLWSWVAEAESAGLTVLLYGDDGYPERLLGDPDPPLVLSVDGCLERCADRAVAVVGTRGCSRGGFETAFALGRDLGVAGVSVVSGLARGVDAAAHLGALDAGAAAPLAVVATGLDVVYPRQNGDLWRRVAGGGAVISEAPLGARPDRWRFPSRNRIIAAMADLVVVVESPDQGGSLYTVDEADRRGIEVLAVPGPVRSRTHAGSNALLHEGRGVARDAQDVLVALGFVAAPGRRTDPTAQAGDPLLEAFEWEAVTIDQLCLRTGLGLVEVAARLDRLVADGAVTASGGWYERVGGAA